jgi:hypothetical protein
MRIISNAIIPFFLAMMLVSCTEFISTPAMSPTDVIETATPLTSTETPVPIIQSSPILVSGTPTTVVMENELTWIECVLPNQDYAHSMPNIEFVTKCLNRERPYWDDNDRKMAGERIAGSNGSDLQQVIGNDVFLAKHDSTNGCCDYEFLKNGNVIIKTSAPLITFDPNRNLWNIEGKSVWELITDPPVMIVDGINFNEKYQLEGSYFPYAIKNKLIYIARKNGKYDIVYDEKVIGPEFDETYMAYCCGTTKVLYGQGQYWFWGKREGMYFVVAIH